MASGAISDGSEPKQAAILAESTDTAKIRSFFQKIGSNPLVRDRALVFSPRAPFVLVPEISQNANKDAGDTAGGVRGGMPCRPPSVVCDGAIFGDFFFFENLRRGRDSKLTASVQVSYFRWSMPHRKYTQPFRIPSRDASSRVALSFTHSLSFIRCGEEGIRTLDALSDIHPFQGCPFDRSGTSPLTI